eukprot:13822457-Heterocapsa_arctica.AAC.1
MVSGGLALAAETKVDNDTQIHAHYPVQLKVGGKLSEDMGEKNQKTEPIPRYHEERGQEGNHT